MIRFDFWADFLAVMAETSPGSLGWLANKGKQRKPTPGESHVERF
jgi:hypothetical protein